MKRHAAELLSLCLLVLSVGAPRAYPWGVEGHKAIALEATRQLTPQARAHVVQILGSDDLASIAVWMDQVRAAYFHQGPLGADPEALKFNAEFPKNGEWHYVDLPLGTKAYDPEGPYATPHDVVHEIEEAVDVLEGHGDSRITPREALCMLVHFVGDLHQPFHVGVGFYRVSADGKVELVTDPEQAKGLPGDRGGNALFYGPGKYEELHAYWDDTLVHKLAHSEDPAILAPMLEAQAAAAGSSWKSAGDYHHWAEGWATQSLVAARTAYAGIMLGAETPDPRGGIKRIAITFKPDYDAVSEPVAEQRLAQAGFHLAEILNAIHWQG